MLLEIDVELILDSQKLKQPRTTHPSSAQAGLVLQKFADYGRDNNVRIRLLGGKLRGIKPKLINTEIL
jgi:hypothetical protein